MTHREYPPSYRHATSDGISFRCRAPHTGFIIFHLILIGALAVLTFAPVSSPWPRIGVGCALVAGLLLHALFAIISARTGTLAIVSPTTRTLTIGETTIPFADIISVHEVNASSADAAEFREEDRSSQRHGRFHFLYIQHRADRHDHYLRCARIHNSPEGPAGSAPLASLRLRLSELTGAGSQLIDRLPASALQRAS